MEKGRNYLIKLFKSTYPKNNFLLQDIKRNKILPPTARNVDQIYVRKCGVCVPKHLFRERKT